MSAGAPAPGLAGRLVDWMAVNRHGLDALMAEEGSRAVHEEFLIAHGRLFVEALAGNAAALADQAPRELSRRVAALLRAGEARRRDVEARARAAWTQPDADGRRVGEAAAVWAHVRVLAEAFEQALPEAST